MTPEERALLKELVRRQSRPYMHYKPGPTQAAFLACPKPFKALHGPNRGGKTFHMDMEAAMMMEDRHPHLKQLRNRRFLYVVPKRQNAGTTHKEYFLERSKLKIKNGGDEMVPGPVYEEPMLDMSETEYRLDKTKDPHAPRTITNTRTGNTMLFIWASAGKSAQEALEGASFDGCFIDESAGTAKLLAEIKLRLLDAQADKTKPGMGFMYWAFTETKVNQAGNDFLANCYDDTQEDYAAFRIKPDENPVISMEDRLKLAEGMSEEEQRIRIHGTSSAQGEVAIYPQFQDEKKRETLIREEPYVQKQDDNICISFDPGVDHPCGILFAYTNKYKPNKIQVFHFENNSNEGPKEAIEHIRRVLNGRKIAHFAYDHFGASRREFGSGKSAIQQMVDLIPEKWWAPGHMVVKKPKGQHAHGINAVRQYLSPPLSLAQYPLVEFDPPTADNGMSTALAQMTEYRGREDLNFAGPHGVVKINDEFPDCLRYLILTSPHWIDYGYNLPSKPMPYPRATAENRADYMGLNLEAPEMTPEEKRWHDQMQRSKQIGAKRKRARGNRIRRVL